tara:strand:+ start:346 stop:453 length:108 start_codon:yes stop_codon:yes gene_type:complete
MFMGPSVLLIMPFLAIEFLFEPEKYGPTTARGMYY